MDVSVGLWQKLKAEKLMLLNCGVGEDSWESLGLQGDPTCPFWRRSAQGIFGRNDAKAETPVLWPPHVKSWLIGKDTHAGRDWGQEEKGTTEDEMDVWHHWLDGQSGWIPGVGDGQRGLACCYSWRCKESYMTELLNWSPVAYWAPTHLGSSSFSILLFCLFILFMGFSRQEYWSDLPFPSPVDHSLSDLSTMTCSFWMAPHGIASFN